MKVVLDIAKSVVKLGASKAKTVAATPVFEAKGLVADTVEFSQQTVKKVAKKAEDFMPAVFKGSDVPMHHEINGFNHEIRIAHEYSAKSLPVTDREWYKMKIESGIARREEVDAAFARLKPLEKDCIVYRGRS